jgi:hypothetical protein
MNAANGNGANGKLSWWLIGLLTTIGLGVAGGTIRSVQNDGERIAALESQIKDTLHPHRGPAQVQRFISPRHALGVPASAPFPATPRHPPG